MSTADVAKMARFWGAVTLAFLLYGMGARVSWLVYNARWPDNAEGAEIAAILWPVALPIMIGMNVVDAAEGGR